MKCAEVSEMLFDYAEGRLEPEVELMVASHLERCERCALEVAEWQHIAALLRDTAPIRPSEGLVQRITREAKSQAPAQRQRRSRWRNRILVSETTWNVAASFVGALLLLVVGEFLLTGQGNSISGLVQKPSEVAGTASIQTVQSVFTHFGSYVNEVFSTLLRLTGELGGMMR